MPPVCRRSGIHEKLGLSARAYHWVPKVTRTLGDLERTVGGIHLAEAVPYRMRSERVAQRRSQDP